MRGLDTGGLPVVAPHGVVLTLEVKRALSEAVLQKLYRLGQPGNAHPRLVQRNPRLVIVGGLPASSEAQLQASVGQQVQCRCLLGQKERVPEVVA